MLFEDQSLTTKKVVVFIVVVVVVVFLVVVVVVIFVFSESTVSPIDNPSIKASKQIHVCVEKQFKLTCDTKLYTLVFFPVYVKQALTTFS